MAPSSYTLGMPDQAMMVGFCEWVEHKTFSTAGFAGYFEESQKRALSNAS
jgi:hypothetical protein